MNKSRFRLGMVIAIVLVMMVAMSCGEREDEGEAEEVAGMDPVETQNKDSAKRFLEEVWGKGNLEVADELLAPNFILHNPPQDVVPTAEGYKQWVSMTTSQFTVIEARIDDLIAEADMVVTRWTYVTTHDGEFAGIPPTGKQITMTGISIDRFRDGKIVEEWIEMDQLGMMLQLGLELKPKETEK